jgi:hypothetical protein
MTQSNMQRSRRVLRNFQMLPDSNRAILAIFLVAVVMLTVALVAGSRPADVKIAVPFDNEYHGRYVSAVRSRNVGAIPRGGLAHFSFDIHNASDLTVRLRPGVSSCSCLVSDLTSKILEPGQSATVAGTIQGRNPGVARSTFMVHAFPSPPAGETEQPPPQDDVMFEVLGSVDAGRGLIPQLIQLKTARSNAQPERRVLRFLWEFEQDAQLELESVTLPTGVSVEMPSRLQQRGLLAQSEGAVIVDPKKLPSDQDHLAGSATFTLKSRTRESPCVFKLNVLVDVLEDVVAVPNVLYWSKGGNRDPVTVRFQAADGIAVTIDDLSFDKQILDCRVEKAANGQETVIVTCLAVGGAQLVRSKVVINVTYGPEQKKTAITLSALII